MKDIVVVDVDGTLTTLGDRLRCIESKPKDYEEFYRRCGEDRPVVEVIRLVNQLSMHYRIIVCTGRPESCRDATEMWFTDNDLSCHGMLMLMRPDGDDRPDTVVKPEILSAAIGSLERVAFVLDDRGPMVAQWRDLGLLCFQVIEDTDEHT